MVGLYWREIRSTRSFFEDLIIFHFHLTENTIHLLSKNQPADFV
jgi:hypothetical protein